MITFQTLESPLANSEERYQATPVPSNSSAQISSVVIVVAIRMSTLWAGDQKCWRPSRFSMGLIPNEQFY